MIGFDFAFILCFFLVVFTRLPSDFSWRFRLYGEDVRQAAVSAFLVLGRGIAILGRGKRSCSTWDTVVSTWGNWVDGPVVDGPAVDGLAVDGPAVDGPAVDDLATAAGIRASDGSVAPAVKRTADPSWCALWSSCRVLSGCSSMSRTTGRAQLGSREVFIPKDVAIEGPQSAHLESVDGLVLCGSADVACSKDARHLVE